MIPNFASSVPLRIGIDRRNALPIAIAMWVLAAIGDHLTAAEVGFTLLYLLPISITVWWRGLSRGIAFCVLSTAAATVLGGGHGARSPWIVVWNLAGELGVFVVFALVLHRLRLRLDVEVSQRESAVVQLRHADRLNTVGKLASGIAHELGTPLNVVAGRASLIASHHIEGEEACRSARVIVEQASRMTTIIEKLLTFARRGGAQRTNVDLVRVVRETVSLLEPLARKQHVEFEVDAKGTHVGRVNAGEIQQVLTNLIMNAVQAMPDGGVIHIGVESPVQREETGAFFVCLSVRDEGVGIPPDVLPHVFDPFFTTKEVGTGTGLGLSVTFGIVRDHGGFIEARSPGGGGSRGAEFLVFLPR